MQIDTTHLVETCNTDLLDQTQHLADTLAGITPTTATDLIHTICERHLDNRPTTEHQDDTCILAIVTPH